MTLPPLSSSRHSADLFTLCDRLAWQVGGPVLIHDSKWGVLAYSTLSQEIDDVRRATILQRTIYTDPEHTAALHAVRESWVRSGWRHLPGR